jgi:diguanylate cyclase (GGDEF)-like protein
MYTESLAPAKSPERTKSVEAERAQQERLAELERRLEALEVENRELRERNNTLEKLAYEDPLTGLVNRRGLEQALTRISAEAKREGVEPDYTLLGIDLDGFKGINDTLGHPVGDEALERIANELRHAVREVDTIARVGGDEFMIVLPNASTAEGQKIAQRVLSAIRDTVGTQMEDAYGEAFTGVAASIGVLSTKEIGGWHEKGTSTEAMFETVDTLLYDAKARKTTRVDEDGRKHAGAGTIVTMHDLITN